MSEPIPRQAGSLPSPSQPFNEWQQAVADLKAAEARGADHDVILDLSERVIRARNALTVDRMQSGWSPPDDILNHLTVDDRLLHEGDDHSHPR
jgi:hypothetical protein